MLCILGKMKKIITGLLYFTLSPLLAAPPASQIPTWEHLHGTPSAAAGSARLQLWQRPHATRQQGQQWRNEDQQLQVTRS